MNSSELVNVQDVVRRIGRALSDQEDPQELYSLATQYSDYCANANSRLASCVEILGQGKGKEYAALMHATRTPDVLELLAVLSDPDLSEWRTFCKDNRLPVPEPLNEDAKQQLDPIYAQANSFNDQLFGEYTAAQTRRDFEEALRIIRQISHINPDDQGAARQVAGLEKRLRKKELEKLEVAINAGDRNEVIALLDRIAEISPGYEGEGTVWDRAMDTLATVRREEATAKCKRLLAQVESAYGEKSLDVVMPLTAEIESLVDEHDVDLGAESSELLEEISEWSKKMVQKLRLEDQFDRAVMVLEETVETIRKKDFKSSKSKLPELHEDKTRLDKAWHDVAQFRKGIATALKDGAEKCNGDLDRKIKQMEKTRVRLLVGAVATAVVLTVVASGFTILRVKAKGQAERLKRLVEQEQVLEVERTVTELDAEQSLTLRFSQLADQLVLAKTWLRQEQEKVPQLEAAVARLEQTLAGLNEGWDNAKGIAFRDQLARGREMSATVAADYRAELEGRINAASDQWQVLVGKERELRVADFRQRLDEVNAQAKNIDFSKPPKEVATLLAELQTKLGELELLTTPEIDELVPPDSDVNRFGLVRESVARDLGELEKLQEVTTKAIEATRLEDYLAAMEGLSGSPFMRGEQQNAWRELRKKVLSTESFLRSVLMPDDLLAWESFSNAPDPSLGYPGAMFPNEQGIFLELRDNADLRDMYRYTLDSSDNASGLPLYVRTSALEPFGTSRSLRGREVYSPWRQRTHASFEPAEFNAARGPLPTNGGVSPESVFFSQLALNQYVGDQLDVYQDSLLKVLDGLIEAEEINPLYRAYIFEQLHRLMISQNDQWGFSWCSIGEDFQRLRNSIKTLPESSHWMVPLYNESMAKPIREFFESLKGVSYYDQVRVVSRFFSVAFRNGFEYAGFVDYFGERQATPSRVSGNALWGINENLQPQILFRKSETDDEWQTLGEAHALTPLFMTITNAEKQLESICRTVGADHKHPSIRKRIPAVFFPADE